MKKILLSACVMVLSATPLFAAGIVSSKHNLSASGTASIKDNSQGQICIFCHVPHNAYNTSLLWSRDKVNGITPAGTFRMYSSTTGSTAIRTSQTQLNGTESSYLCLTCHDGSLSDMALNTKAYTATLSGTESNWGSHARIGNAPNIGGGTGILRDDHPINFNYDASVTAKGGANSGLRDRTALEDSANPNTLVVGSAKPFDGSGKMQCNSCHLVHNEGNTSGLLRKPKAGSAICLTCHTK